MPNISQLYDIAGTTYDIKVSFTGLVNGLAQSTQAISVATSVAVSSTLVSLAAPSAVFASVSGEVLYFTAAPATQTIQPTVTLLTAPCTFVTNVTPSIIGG